MRRIWVVPGTMVFIFLCFPMVIVLTITGIADCFFWLFTGRELIDIDKAVDTTMKPVDWCYNKAGLI